MSSSVRSASASGAGERPRARRMIITAALAVAAAVVWWLLVSNLERIAHALVYDALGMSTASRLASAMAFFVYEAPKVLMLLLVVVFGVGIVRSFFTPERTRRLLAGRRQALGNVLGSLLGVVTPFCSCSAVPLFIGFVTTGVPLGVTFSFLIAAPMINEVALVLLFGTGSWEGASDKVSVTPALHLAWPVDARRSQQPFRESVPLQPSACA